MIQDVQTNYTSEYLFLFNLHSSFPISLFYVWFSFHHIYVKCVSYHVYLYTYLFAFNYYIYSSFLTVLLSSFLFCLRSLVTSPLVMFLSISIHHNNPLYPNLPFSLLSSIDFYAMLCEIMHLFAWFLFIIYIVCHSLFTIIGKELLLILYIDVSRIDKLRFLLLFWILTWYQRYHSFFLKLWKNDRIKTLIPHRPSRGLPRGASPSWGIQGWWWK